MEFAIFTELDFPNFKVKSGFGLSSLEGHGRNSREMGSSLTGNFLTTKGAPLVASHPTPSCHLEQTKGGREGRRIVELT